MKKNISISLLAILGLCGVTVAQEDYQGQLSDKKLQSMGILSSGSVLKGSLETSKESFDYDKEYEDLLKSIHTSDNDNYELDSKLLDAELTHYEDDYDTLLNKASEILGEEKVATLTNRIENTILDKESKKKAVQFSSNNIDIVDDSKVKKEQIIHIKNANDLTRERFAPKKESAAEDILNSEATNLSMNDNAKNYAINDDTDNLYQNLLDGLSDGSGDEVDQLFNLASEEELEGDEYKYKLDDGYPIEEVTTVGLFKGPKRHFKKCLIIKTYGGGTWRTYCQPIAKPTQCTDQEWKDLSTMAIMYC